MTDKVTFQRVGNDIVYVFINGQQRGHLGLSQDKGWELLELDLTPHNGDYVILSAITNEIGELNEKNDRSKTKPFNPATGRVTFRNTCDDSILVYVDNTQCGHLFSDNLGHWQINYLISKDGVKVNHDIMAIVMNKMKELEEG